MYKTATAAIVQTVRSINRVVRVNSGFEEGVGILLGGEVEITGGVDVGDGVNVDIEGGGTNWYSKQIEVVSTVASVSELMVPKVEV